jgi:nucleoid DNA-binding protein
MPTPSKGIKKFRRSGATQLAKFALRYGRIPKAFTKAVVAMLPSFVASELCAGNRVEFQRLGRFSLKLRKGRTTGGVFQPTSLYPKFKASAWLRAEIKKNTKPTEV